MAKGEQRNDKANKKPKKDNSLPQDSSGTSTRPVAPVTSVAPNGKLKNKYAFFLSIGGSTSRPAVTIPDRDPP